MRSAVQFQPRHKPHEHERRGIEHRIAEPEGDRGAGRRLTLAQPNDDGGRAARAHHARHGENSGSRDGAEARLAQDARHPISRQQRLDRRAEQKAEHHRLPDGFAVSQGVAERRVP